MVRAHTGRLDVDKKQAMGMNVVDTGGYVMNFSDGNA